MTTAKEDETMTEETVLSEVERRMVGRWVLLHTDWPSPETVVACSMAGDPVRAQKELVRWAKANGKGSANHVTDKFPPLPRGRKNGYRLAEDIIFVGGGTQPRRMR
jgi:hypothetical protein